jgi:alkyl hydroperoxide reductase subunit F
MYELIIIGGGPAGTAATVYAARKQLKTLLIAEEFGGQSSVSTEIYNWIGDKAISGYDLAKKFEEHVRDYEKDDTLDIIKGSRVTALEKIDGGFQITTNKDESFSTKTILVASGSSRRKLDVPGAAEFEHKGVVYCASCDGPLFADMDVAVIGGGNAGFESAAQLLAYAKSVTLLHRRDEYKADEITVEKVLKDPKMTGLTNVEPTKVEGDGMVSKLYYKEMETNEEKSIDVQGIFVEIGQIPNTGFIKGLVELDEFNLIKVDPHTQRSSLDGIWAAGDATNGFYHQNNIAAGDAVKATENLYLYLRA